MGERRRALVVGIDAYGDGISPLENAVRDAESVRDQLEQVHRYNVVLLRDGEATKDAIMSSLASVVDEGLSGESSFVLYYAGHGIGVDNADGTGLPQGFVLAQDAHRHDKQTWLGMELLRDALDGLSCRHLMLVLDCCYAGAFQWTSTRSVGVEKRPLYKSQYRRYREGTAWQVLTSASHDEKADDAAPITSDRGLVTPEGHSPFAQALIEGLSGSAADSSRAGMAADGVITATELHQFIGEKMKGNPRQTPGIFPLRPDNKGEFVFLPQGVDGLNLEPDPELDEANNPWRGPDAYTAADHDLFFGRTEATTDLLRRVEADRFVAVVGASGSGKSSLIQAGLLPTLGTRGWNIVELHGSTAGPLAQLDEASAQLAADPGSERRLLVVDHFDELLKGADGGARARFVSDLRALVDSHDGQRILIALRSEQTSAELGDLWNTDVRFEVPAFSRSDLLSIVIEAARTKAVFFEPAQIVDDLVDAVHGMPGAAPLLSLTLADLYRRAFFRRRSTGEADRMISSADYRAVGGVEGVVHRLASHLHDSAPTAQDQRAIRQVLLRLVDQTPEGSKRRSVDRSELFFGADDDSFVNSMIDSFTAKRLLTVGNSAGRDYVEPAHDALVSTWNWQVSWLLQSGSQDVVRDASKASRDWHDKDAKSKRSKHLWNQNPQLDELKRCDENQEPKHELNALEQEFVSASTSRQRRLAQIRRVAISALTVLTVVAVVGVIWALIEQSNTKEEAKRASSRALASGALINVEIETDLAALLALESGRVANTADARGSLAGVLSLPTRFLQRTAEHDGDITAIAFSESSRTAATADSFGVVKLWEVNEEPFPQPQATVLGEVEIRGEVRDLFITDDAEFPVLAFDTEGFAHLLDFTTGDVDLFEPPDEFAIATVSSDLGFFAGVTLDGVLRVYEVDDDVNFTEVEALDVGLGDKTDLAFSPDGTMLAWGDENRFSLWSWNDLGEPFVIDADDAIRAIAFSPDDNPDQAIVAVGVAQGSIFLVDRSDPSLIEVSPSPVNELFDLAFKPDLVEDEDGDVNFVLASTHSNGDVVLFEVLSSDEFEPFGYPVETMLGHNDEAKKVAFAPDGRIASGDFLGEVIWWLDVPQSSLGIPWTMPADLGQQTLDAAFVASSEVVSFDDFQQAWRLDLESFELEPIVEDLRVTSVDAASDVIAVGLIDGRAQILEPDGAFVRSLVADHPQYLDLVALSSDGSQLATVSPWFLGGPEGYLAIWDVASGDVVNEQELPTGFEPMSAIFADDGVVWLGGRSNGNLPAVLKIDATSGAAIEFEHSGSDGAGVTALGLSDDGQTLATGAGDRRIALWDTDTLDARPGGEFTGHRDDVTGIVFWDDGDTLISSDDAGDVLMWDVSTRRQFGLLGGPTDDVRSLELDTENATLLAASEDGFVWTWTLDLKEWRDRACQLAGRNMTDAEWKLYGAGGTRVRHCVDFPAGDGDVRDAEYGESLTD